MMSASSLALDVSILRGVTQWKWRACAAEPTVVSSFAWPACVLFTALESVAASLQAVARRTYYFQEVLKVSETLGDYEQMANYIPLWLVEVTLAFCSWGLDTRKSVFWPVRESNFLLMSLCLSLYCISPFFFFLKKKHSSCLCFLIMNVKEVSPAGRWLNFTVDVLSHTHWSTVQNVFFKVP